MGTIGVAVNVRVRVFKRGVMVRETWTHNKVVDVGLNVMRDRLGNGNFNPSHIAVGTDNTAPVAGDTLLGTEVFRKAITFTDIDDNSVSFECFLGSTEANGNTLAEAGLFNNMFDDRQEMFSRVLITPTIAKDAETTATIAWVLTFTRASGASPVDTGLDTFALLMTDQENPLIEMAVGTDGTAVTAADTALGAEVFREAIARRLDAAQQIKFQMDLATGDANGNTLRECALFDDAGVMFARAIISPPIVKTVSISTVLEFQFDLAEA